MRAALHAALIVAAFTPYVAQAQSANVTFYGYLNLDIEVIIQAKQDATSGTPGTPPSGATQNVYRVSSNSTRFGFRGAESLGGGVNAIFQIESQADAANSGGALAQRDTFVGIQAGHGTVKIGYFFSPYYNLGAIWSNALIGRTGILASQSLWANAGYNGSNAQTGSFAQRLANSVRYDTRDLGGFIGTVQVSGRDTGGDNGGDLAQQRRHAYVTSAGGTYHRGPFTVGAVYEQRNNLRQGTAAFAKLKDKGAEVAGAYDFGAVKVAAAYERLEYDLSTGGDLRRRYWAISATANVGPGQLYVGYWTVGDSKGSGQCATVDGITTCPRVGALTVGPDSGAQQFEISYTYPLSKRTLLYAGYTYIDNDRNAAYNFGGASMPGLCTGNARNAQGVNVGCGDAGKPQGLTVGILHFF